MNGNDIGLCVLRWLCVVITWLDVVCVVLCGNVSPMCSVCVDVVCVCMLYGEAGCSFIVFIFFNF